MAVSGHHARLGTRLRARLCRGLHFRRLNFMSFKAQPAQIRTGASTLTALIVNTNGIASCRTPAESLAHADPRSVSGACNSGDVLHDPCPSLPNLRRRLPSLVRRFTGTTTWSDFSSTCMSALWFMAFADRPWPLHQGVLEISRFSCMLFLSVRGFSRLRRTGQPLAYNATAVLPSSSSEWSRHPVLPAFRSSIAPPTDASGLRFKKHLAMSPARLEVRMDSLLPFL
jgi:hypothetical protein